MQLASSPKNINNLCNEKLSLSLVEFTVSRNERRLEHDETFNGKLIWFSKEGKCFIFLFGGAHFQQQFISAAERWFARENFLFPLSFYFSFRTILKLDGRSLRFPRICALNHLSSSSRFSFHVLIVPLGIYLYAKLRRDEDENARNSK